MKSVIAKYGRRLNVQELLSEFFEFATSGVKAISTDHALIHQKRGFMTWVEQESLADGASIDITFTTPEDGYIHMKQYDCWVNSASAVLRVYENPTSASGGDTLVAQNRSRVLPLGENNSTMRVGDSIVLGDAVKVDEIRFGGGGVNPQSRAGGQRSLDMELLLNPATTYVLRLTNDSGVAASVWLSLFWYEEMYG